MLSQTHLMSSISSGVSYRLPGAIVHLTSRSWPVVTACARLPPPRDLLPKYMTPLEAEEVMRRLWRNEAALLRLIYAAELGKVIGGTGRADLLRAGETTDKPGREASDSKCSNEGYRMFFVRVLPVAPNKFRPPSKIGEEM